MIKTFDALINRAFQQAFASDGRVISERRKNYFIQRWSALYKELLDWGLQWEAVGVSEDFQRLFELQRQKALAFANEVRGVATRLERELQDAIDHPGRDVHISLSLDVDEGHGEEFERELRKALLSIDPQLTGLMDET